jgi:hypothetical protein
LLFEIKDSGIETLKKQLIFLKNYTFAVFSKRRGGKAKAKDRLPTGMRSQKHEKMTYGSTFAVT